MENLCINSTLGSTPVKAQSLNKAITYQGSHQVQADISTTDAAPVKRSYRVIDRRALKLAQFFARMQESEWSYHSAVHYLKLAYGFPSESPAFPI